MAQVLLLVSDEYSLAITFESLFFNGGWYKNVKQESTNWTRSDCDKRASPNWSHQILDPWTESALHKGHW